MTDPTPEVEFRVYVGDELKVAERIGPSPEAVDAAVRRHMQITAAAEANDGVWVIEIIDPEGEFYPIVMSNDPAKMVIPLPLNPDNAQLILNQRKQQLGLD